MRRLPFLEHPEDLDDFARGCAVLGSGGGGDVRAGWALARACVDQGCVPPLVDPTTLDAATPVALVGAVGSPTVMSERLPSGEEFAKALGRLQERAGVRLGAVAPLEIGGINGLLAVVAACRSGLALLDADGMGRAWPRLDQCVLADTVPAVPLVLADPSGGLLTVEGLRPSAVEPTVRGVLPALGTWAALAAFGTTASVLAARAVPGSLSRALRVGRALAGRRDHPAAGAAAATASEGAGERVGEDFRELVVGTVAEVLRDDSRLPHGVVTLIDDRSRAVTFRLDHAEEFACVTRDGVPLAQAPDIIALVDARRWEAIGVAEVRLGQRVRLLVLPASDRLRDSPGHDLGGYGMEVPA